MSRVIPHRELRNRSSEVLRDVQAGETIEVTNHGEVVAVLVPPSERLGAGLRIRSAQRVGGFAALTRRSLDHPVQESLDDLRGEE